MLVIVTSYLVPAGSLKSFPKPHFMFIANLEEYEATFFTLIITMAILCAPVLMTTIQNLLG